MLHKILHLDFFFQYKIKTKQIKLKWHLLSADWSNLAWLFPQKNDTSDPYWD